MRTVGLHLLCCATVDGLQPALALANGALVLFERRSATMGTPSTRCWDFSTTGRTGLGRTFLLRSRGGRAVDGAGGCARDHWGIRRRLRPGTVLAQTGRRFVHRLERVLKLGRRWAGWFWRGIWRGHARRLEENTTAVISARPGAGVDMLGLWIGVQLRHDLDLWLRLGLELGLRIGVQLRHGLDLRLRLGRFDRQRIGAWPGRSEVCFFGFPGRRFLGSCRAPRSACRHSETRSRADVRGRQDFGLKLRNAAPGGVESPIRRLLSLAQFFCGLFQNLGEPGVGRLVGIRCGHVVFVLSDVGVTCMICTAQNLEVSPNVLSSPRISRLEIPRNHSCPRRLTLHRRNLPRPPARSFARYDAPSK